MFKCVYEKTHPAAIALAEVRLIGDRIDDRGPMMLASIVLPPHIRVVAPMSGKVNSAKIHNRYELERLGFAKLVEGEGE